MKQYEAYKDSGIRWVGMIPNHWKCAPLKHYMQIKNGKDYKHIAVENGIPVIGSGGQFAYASEYLYDGEALLLGRKGTINRPIYINGKFWTVDTMFYAIPSEKVSCKYIYYQSLGFPFELYATDTALPSITQTTLGNNLICIPTLQEQQAIASYLDYKVEQIDTAIKKYELQLKDLKVYRSTIIIETVTKGLDKNVEMKDSGVEWIGMIPKHWSVNKFKYYIQLSSGDAINREDISNDGLYPVYGGGEKIGYTSQKNVGSNSIVIGRVGARCGCVTLLSTDSWATDNSLVCKTSQCVSYIAYLLKAANLNRLNESNAQPLITSTKIKNLNAAFPPVSEQHKISDFLDLKTKQIDAALSEIEIMIDDLKAYKSSLITEAVTGKIDLRDWNKKM